MFQFIIILGFLSYGIVSIFLHLDNHVEQCNGSSTPKLHHFIKRTFFLFYKWLWKSGDIWSGNCEFLLIFVLFKMVLGPSTKTRAPKICFAIAQNNIIRVYYDTLTQ